MLALSASFVASGLLVLSSLLILCLLELSGLTANMERDEV